MKRTFLIASLAFVFSAHLGARTLESTVDPLNKGTINVQKGEKTFLKHVDRSLVLMEQAADKLGIKGVAVMIFIPGEETVSGVSKMKVVGSMTRKTVNFLAVANSKIAEMADTHLDSGSKVREPLTGETGWRGGLIKKVESGYIMAAFSGGTEDEDIVVANAGIENMLKRF